MQVADFWEKQSDGHVLCRLCPQACLIAEGCAGRCGVRMMRGGVLYAGGYGLLSGAHVDSIEKKPLYHFHPGAAIYSIGGWGCNLSCRFCQNWGISQTVGRSERFVAPADIVTAAERAGTPAIAYTYNEPLINFEFVRDCLQSARAANVRNVLVTNGMLNEVPARDILPLVDALNLDIKSMQPEFYRDYCGGALAPVLDFARWARSAGCHVEITNLVIPGLNDADALFEQLAGWISDQLGPATPLHLSAYHPAYRMQHPATAPDSIAHAAEICRRRLHYVYLGNINNHSRSGAVSGRDTMCPGCGNMLVSRAGYDARICGLTTSAPAHPLCSQCGRPADLVLP